MLPTNGVVVPQYVAVLAAVDPFCRENRIEGWNCKGDRRHGAGEVCHLLPLADVPNNGEVLYSRHCSPRSPTHAKQEVSAARYRGKSGVGHRGVPFLKQWTRHPSGSGRRG